MSTKLFVGNLSFNTTENDLHDAFAAHGTVVEANLPKDARLIVGCKSGGRSANACQIMSQIGYQDVTNMRGGFGGAADRFGQVVEPGWAMLNLPVATEAAESADYETLAAKAKK